MFCVSVQKPQVTWRAGGGGQAPSCRGAKGQTLGRPASICGAREPLRPWGRDRWEAGPSVAGRKAGRPRRTQPRQSGPGCHTPAPAGGVTPSRLAGLLDVRPREEEGGDRGSVRRVWPLPWEEQEARAGPVERKRREISCRCVQGAPTGPEGAGSCREGTREGRGLSLSPAPGGRVGTATVTPHRAKDSPAAPSPVRPAPS